MKVFVNDRNEIKDVHSTKDNTLTEIIINDAENPFENWSIAKICCYRVDVREGVVCMFTPYVNSLIIEHLDRLGEQNGQTEETVTNLEVAVCENYESAELYKEETNSQIDNLQLAVVEVYEMLLGGI